MLGTVLEISKNGKAFNAKVDLGSEQKWYGCGFAKPAFAVGTNISFDVKVNGKWENIDQDSVQVVAQGPVAKAPATASGKSSYAAKDDYWNRKEERDVQNDKNREIGASRNTAIAFVNLLIQNKGLDLSKVKKAGEIEGIIFQAVEYYAEVFRGDAQGPEVEDVNKEKEIKEEDE